MNPLVEMPNLSKEPTCGQLDNQLANLFPEDQRPDDGMFHVGHWRYSVLSEMGQSKLMGSIHCTRIPFILIATNQSHLSSLSGPYSADPPVDLKTHTGTGTIELFFVMILMNPLCLQTYVLCLVLSLS